MSGIFPGLSSQKQTRHITPLTLGCLYQEEFNTVSRPSPKHHFYAYLCEYSLYFAFFGGMGRVWNSVLPQNPDIVRKHKITSVTDKIWLCGGLSLSDTAASITNWEDWYKVSTSNIVPT